MDERIQDRDSLPELYGYTPEVVAFLGFASLPGVGFASLRHIGGPAKVVQALAVDDDESFLSHLTQAGIRSFPYPGKFETRQELKRAIWSAGQLLAQELAERQVRFIAADQPNFPKAGADLPASMRPLWLFVRGNERLLDATSVAVVGTRKPSSTGLFLTRYVVAVAATLDLPVVSGLAYGIDTVAHECALELGHATISVLGNGILSPYPARNAHLADEIVRQGGTIISEYLPHAAPSADSFVWRNRLQACFSSALVATEWKMSSGTAHTVRFAQQLSRPSISVSLSRKARAADAGKAELHLELPREHAELVRVLSSPTPKPMQAMQQTLF